MKPAVAVCSSFALYLSVLYSIARAVNTTVDEPYLDEIFHVPQTQRYCARDWTWDDKITTPAGPYLVFAALHQVIRIPCELAYIRGLNAVLVACLPLLFFDLLRRIRGRAGLQTWLEALTLASFPLVYFFAFLFYTDVASLIIVLCSYDAALAGQIALSSLLGVMSLAFRQTNILWIAFVGLDSLARALHTKGLRNPPLSTATPYTFFSGMASFLVAALSHWRTTLFVGGVYLPVPLAFAAFLRWNAGIVLGDKTNHQSTLHLPQLLYFAAFTSFFAWPVLVRRSTARAVFQTHLGSVRRLARLVAVCLALCWIVSRFTIEHPFLLADNRHYTFYVWRKIYRRHWTAPYLSTPLYVFAFSAVFDRLARDGHMKAIQSVGFCLVTSAALIPSPLIEPRYYITPFLLARLHLVSDRRTGLELAWYALLNGVTLWLFLARPFRWPQDPHQWQRFMW